MNDDDFERFKEFNAWSKSQPVHDDTPVNQLNITKSTIKPKQAEILIPIYYVWITFIAGLILLIAAWPFTLLGFFIGLFVRFKFFGDK